MMRYLDGKPTDDKRYLAQPYVTSLSLLLVASFKTALCGSLAIAFTQHLWRVLRTNALSVSVIESLHGVRYNPLLLGKWQVGRSTPVLYVTALVMWLLAVAILFPPSALVVVRHDFQEQSSRVVPTFDTAYPRGITRMKMLSSPDMPFGNSSLSAWAPARGSFNEASMGYL